MSLLDPSDVGPNPNLVAALQQQAGAGQQDPTQLMLGILAGAGIQPILKALKMLNKPPSDSLPHRPGLRLEASQHPSTTIAPMLLQKLMGGGGGGMPGGMPGAPPSPPMPMPMGMPGVR